jgi:hypothetical protein
MIITVMKIGSKFFLAERLGKSLALCGSLPRYKEGKNHGYQ